MNIIVAILFSIVSLAATAPTTFDDPQLKIKLEAPDKSWVFLDSEQVPRANSEDDLLLRLVAKGKPNAQGVQPSLSLRVDPGIWKSAKTYAEKWLKEYPKFGYELQFAREAQYGPLKGFEMEMSSLATDRRVHQFVVQRPKDMWVFTCTANPTGFNSAWESCEKMLKSAKISNQ